VDSTLPPLGAQLPEEIIVLLRLRVDVRMHYGDGESVTQRSIGFDDRKVFSSCGTLLPGKPNTRFFAVLFNYCEAVKYQSASR
jgi:hypothetical protein